MGCGLKWGALVVVAWLVAGVDAQSSCNIGYYDDGSGTGSGTTNCVRCPHMTTTNSTGKTSVYDCLEYKPLVSYQFEDVGDLGKDSSGNGRHATVPSTAPVYSIGRRGSDNDMYGGLSYMGSSYFDMEQHYFPLYYPTGCLQNSYNPNPLYAFYPQLVASKGFPGISPDVNGAASAPVASWDLAFQQLVASNTYGTIVRVCYDCALTHWLIFYKRILPVDADWSVSKNMLYSWASDRNKLNLHFKLYGSEADYLADTNAWTSCNYDSTVGSFRDCGGAAYQWIATSGTNAANANNKNAVFYLLKDCTLCSDQKTTGVTTATASSQCTAFDNSPQWCPVGSYSATGMITNLEDCGSTTGTSACLCEQSTIYKDGLHILIMLQIPAKKELGHHGGSVHPSIELRFVLKTDLTRTKSELIQDWAYIVRDEVNCVFRIEAFHGSHPL
ncbi:hypothetical protein GUITHDRAFT_147762 [Guillardia theta CCMP2712]|uniref:Uncharacterized protein n=1 Tax=Guillardia theta (strain CCMP2712) TaxID=905079 RepID=L1IBL9_GUITC|nr:hypothetical protein GUITHDRAFT_147762 [Guillardia theta CCMP2712]EKX33633.1 hypothetical protein GUITHDRAFT_147762 [Guillardia theta CCMP2712]|eukprot:XP_005820613.1 hypothetical protein GUITHDRAFT_147762 [Guillardia theta CCMP2712]